MLRETERNAAMMNRILSVVKKYPQTEEAVTLAVAKANLDADSLSGTKSVEWAFGCQQFQIAWTLKQGSIMEVLTRRIEVGPVRVTHEERFFG